MTYGDFKALLDRYLKRTDLRDLYDDWFLFTSLRIDKQLRLSEQEVVDISVPTARVVSLPSDFIEMRSLATSAGGGQIPSIGSNSINIYFGGFTDNPVQFEWLSNFNQYEIAENNIPLRDYFAAQVGNDISVIGYEVVPVAVVNGNGNGQ
jgi:hypothetical protein